MHIEIEYFIKRLVFPKGIIISLLHISFTLRQSSNL